jgi:hypothetical protein
VPLFNLATHGLGSTVTFQSVWADIRVLHLESEGGEGWARTVIEYGLAFQKAFLEGDERWKPLLLQEPAGLGSSMVTSIK